MVLIHKAIPQVATKQQTEDQSAAHFVYKFYEQMNRDTKSEYSSSSEIERLSSTDPTEPGLVVREVKKCTDPALQATIPDPEAQLDEVRNVWCSTARDKLVKP